MIRHEWLNIFELIEVTPFCWLFRFERTLINAATTYFNNQKWLQPKSRWSMPRCRCMAEIIVHIFWSLLICKNFWNDNACYERSSAKRTVFHAYLIDNPKIIRQLTIFVNWLLLDAVAPICTCLGHVNMRNIRMRFACLRSMKDGGPLSQQRSNHMKLLRCMKERIGVADL